MVASVVFLLHSASTGSRWARVGGQVGVQAGRWASDQEGGREGKTMVAEPVFFSHSTSHFFGAVLPSLMTGCHTTCSRLVSTVPRPVGRPPKTKNAKTLDCLHLSFFIILIDHFYSRHSIQAKCWDA